MTYPCDRCDGMREVYVHERISAHAYLTKWLPCPDCDGTGRKIREVVEVVDANGMDADA